MGRRRGIVRHLRRRAQTGREDPHEVCGRRNDQHRHRIMIELDLLGTHADRAYPLLAGLVTPRPIAWVTTLNDRAARELGEVPGRS